jgi:hypothetical protein
LVAAEAWTLTLLVVLTVLTVVVGLGVAETVAVPVLLGAALIATGDVGFWVVVITVFGLEVGTTFP